MEKEIVKNLIGNSLTLTRINYRGLRLYIQEQPFEYYSGLTGALSAATFAGDPSKKYLTSWRTGMIESFGIKQTNDYVQMTSVFGTLVHEAIVEIKNKGKIDWKAEEERATNSFKDEFMKLGMLPDYELIAQMVFEYQKHVASLLVFIYENVEEIKAIETPVIWSATQIATPVDLVCTIKNKDHCINLKTSSQINDSHLDQVLIETNMWNMTYDDRIDICGILQTKNWRTKPTYTLKTNNIKQEEARFEQLTNQLLLCLNSSASYYPSPEFKFFEGESVLGDTVEIKVKSLKDIYYGK